MNITRPIKVVLVGLLGALAGPSCGGSSTAENVKPGTAAGAGAAGNGASGGESGSAGSGRASGGAGHGAGGTGGGSGRPGAGGVGGGSGLGTGGAGTSRGGSAGAGASAGISGSGGAGSNAGNSSGGSSGESTGGDGGSAGDRAIECTGASQYFPEFDRACTGNGDCVAVAHQTSCCGPELVTGISSTELAAFNAAEGTCERQYPACGCASQGVDVEDGTQIGFSWQDQVDVTCDSGTCKAHYSGTSFACGTRRCTEAQYCVQSSGGPIGTETSYACNPTACTDCSCITMAGCTCSQADGHLTFKCEYA